MPKYKNIKECQKECRKRNKHRKGKTINKQKMRKTQKIYKNHHKREIHKKENNTKNA